MMERMTDKPARVSLDVMEKELICFEQIAETVSPYGQMMEALKEYVYMLFESLGLSGLTFCVELPDDGEADHLYIVTSTATAYIWINGWVTLAGGEVPIYTGETTVIPKVAEEQVLETANTRMEDDVTVTKIPVSDVDNDKGGKTVTIG